MAILGVLVRTPPAQLATLVPRVQGLPGVDLALNPGDGRLVLIMEDVEGAAAADTLALLSRWPDVLATSLVYEYSGPDAPPPSGLPEVDGRSWRESLTTSRRDAVMRPP